MNQKDKAILRELAKKQREYANTPENKERERQWYLHNDLKGDRPLVTIEEWTFGHELARPLACETELAREFEQQLLNNIIGREDLDDDRATPDFFSVRRDAWFLPFNLEPKRIGLEGSMAYEYEPVVYYLAQDRDKLGASKWGRDEKNRNEDKLAIAKEVFEGVIPVREISYYPEGCLTQVILRYMTMETMMISFYDEPELFHDVMKQYTDDLLKFFKELEASGFFITNNQNQGVGQGTCSANTKFEYKDGAKLSDMWGYFDSQETSAISPDMYEEFIFPYYKKLMDVCGLVNYGCCEPVHSIWDNCLSKCDNIRKLSVSPWCDEAFIGDRLRGSSVVYHRKPSPNIVAAEGQFDEEAYSAEIIKTLKAAKGCKLEFSLRDIYSLGGEKERGKRVVRLIRELIERYY